MSEDSKTYGYPQADAGSIEALQIAKMSEGSESSGYKYPEADKGKVEDLQAEVGKMSADGNPVPEASGAKEIPSKEYAYPEADKGGVDQLQIAKMSDSTWIDWGALGYGKMADKQFDPTMTGKAAGESLITNVTNKTADGSPVAAGRGANAPARGASSPAPTMGSESAAAAQATAATAPSSGGGGGAYTSSRGINAKMCDKDKLKAAKAAMMGKLKAKMKASPNSEAGKGMKAAGEGPTFTLPNGTEKSYRDPAGRTLKKGIYAFDRRDAKVPDRLLYPYLCSFVEEAFEHESGEKAHQNVPAADLYKYWAGVVMSELVQYAATNPALARACEKYDVTEKTIGSILRMKKLIQPKSDTMGMTSDADSMRAMGADFDPNGAILALSQETPWTQFDKAPQRDLFAKAEPKREAVQFVDDRGDAFGALAGKQRALHKAQWNGAEQAPVVGSHSSCAIHGRDVYKSSQPGANPWLRCTCNS